MCKIEIIFTNTLLGVNKKMTCPKYRMKCFAMYNTRNGIDTSMYQVCSTMTDKQIMSDILKIENSYKTICPFHGLIDYQTCYPGYCQKSICDAHYILEIIAHERGLK